jgi:hypothetical protein
VTLVNANNLKAASRISSTSTTVTCARGLLTDSVMYFGPVRIVTVLGALVEI